MSVNFRRCIFSVLLISPGTTCVVQNCNIASNTVEAEYPEIIAAWSPSRGRAKPFSESPQIFLDWGIQTEGGGVRLWDITRLLQRDFDGVFPRWVTALQKIYLVVSR